LKLKLGILPSKTYNPPTNIEYFFKEELFPYFLLGLIDGDGCVWKAGTPQIRIEMHYNWNPILEKIKNYMNLTYNTIINTKISNRGYAQLWFGSVHSSKWIYKFSKKSFCMKSKWNKIKEYMDTKYDRKYPE
jgi:hypothetical protein